MARRVMFVVRGKLGESVLPYVMIRAYMAAYPADHVSLLIRRDYAHLLQGERGLRIIPFGSRIEMMARLLWLRLTERDFDALAVLWGFGNPMLRIAQLVRAKRKIYLDGQFAEVYPEWPAQNQYQDLMDPAWFVMQVLDPAVGKPLSLTIPSLVERRRQTPKPGVVGVIPAADEDRRTFDIATLNNLFAAVTSRHPDKKIWLIVNPHDRRAREFMTARFAPNVEIKRFSNLIELIDILAQLDAYYGTDTGVYHLAAAMSIPATVWFGPTQPLKIVLSQQPQVTTLRLAVLGEGHCDVTGCAKPLCLYQCVASFADAECATQIGETPATCPLRAFAAEELPRTTEHRFPLARAVNA
jgi:ADP-heptose:LPS heptosyltransferase